MFCTIAFYVPERKWLSDLRFVLCEFILTLLPGITIKKRRISGVYPVVQGARVNCRKLIVLHFKMLLANDDCGNSRVIM